MVFPFIQKNIVAISVLIIVIAIGSYFMFKSENFEDVNSNILEMRKFEDGLRAAVKRGEISKKIFQYVMNHVTLSFEARERVEKNLSLQLSGLTKDVMKANDELNEVKFNMSQIGRTVDIPAVLSQLSISDTKPMTKPTPIGRMRKSSVLKPYK